MNYFYNLNPKKRFQVAFTSLVLLFFIAYQFSFSKTINSYKDYRYGLETLEKAQDAPAKIRAFKEKIKEVTTAIEEVEYDRSVLFDAIHLYCSDKDISLANFYPEQKKEQGDLELITSPIEVKGSFFEIAQLAYYIEQERNLGHIASINLEKRRNLKTRKEELIGTIYLQNVFPKAKI